MQDVGGLTVYAVQDLCLCLGAGCLPSMTSKYLTTSSQVAHSPSMALSMQQCYLGSIDLQSQSDSSLESHASL